MNDLTEKLRESKAVIKVFGIGGAGVNAVNNMLTSGLEGVQFYAANTDAQALLSSKAPEKIQIGGEVTKGLGAGADPDVGYAAAKESVEEIRKALEGADMVFVTAGMGGGTGTLGASVVAEVAREIGCLTVGVVTKPFLFEGKRRAKNAERGIEELKKTVDTLITIPNQRLLSIAGRNTSLIDTFKKADDILYQAVKGISDLIIFEGLVNVDFADVRAVMSEMGMAMMGAGSATGDNRAVEAAEKAISSPLLEDISIHGARGVLINITASPDVTLQEVNEAAELIQAEAHEDANIIWGMVIDPDLQDEVRVTVIATGFADTMEVKPSPIKNAVNDDRPRFPSFWQPKNVVNDNNQGMSSQSGVRVNKVPVIGSSISNDDHGIPPFLRKDMDKQK
ncbi:MAG: cell division protein FtsZ [Bdellovibrionota bacterium]|nr:cell division protein FtsZ [Pseudomonadota bacterium]MDY6089875.1 cell division protein FtsZ [Bdellovibrionota bacterium]